MLEMINSLFVETKTLVPKFEKSQRCPLLTSVHFSSPTTLVSAFLNLIQFPFCSSMGRNI